MNYSTFESDARHFVRIPQTEEIDIFVTNALRYLIQHVLRNIANAFVITISTTAAPQELWFHDIMAKLFATWGFMAVQLVVHDSKHRDVHVPGRRFCNIIMVDSFENLHRTNISEYNRNYDSEEYYFIFLQIRDSWMPAQREKILKYCLDNYWLHCNVMVQNSRSEVLVYTYFPFQENGCYQTDAVLINQFDGKRFVNADMFPNKLRNLHGCPLKLSIWDIPPFIIFQPNATEPLYGLEMVILQAISKDMNFTIDLDNITAEISLETNRIEAFELLNDRETNITAGFFRRTAERDAIATPTYVTYNLPLVAVILRRQNEYQSLEILTFPFDMCTWTLLILTTISLIVINCFKCKKLRSYSSWHIIEALLGVPSYRVPTHLSIRTTFIMWILSSFILRSVYQSLLFYLYSTQFYRLPPTTLSELAQSDYVAVCSIRSEPILQYNPELMDKSLPLIVLNTTNEMEPLRFLQNHSDQNIVAITVLDFARYFVPRELVSGNVLLLLGYRINIQQISFYFPKHSYLVERIDECILGFHQAGFLENWRKMSLSSNRATQGSYTGQYENQLLVSMKQFLGFMSIVLLLDSVALIVFVMELMSKRVAFLQKLL